MNLLVSLRRHWAVSRLQENKPNSRLYKRNAPSAEATGEVAAAAAAKWVAVAEWAASKKLMSFQ